MIPAEQTQREVISNITEGEEIAFSVSSLANIFDLLHKSMYNDKPTAVAREVISNAIDANLESGTKKKVIVKFPTRLIQMFTVQDFGIGINKERLECFCSYGRSTKTNSNKEIGGFGLGAKSPWSITDQFTITTITGGIKYKYLCYMDGQGIGKVKELFAIPTDEASGTTMEIPVTNSDHIDRIKKQTELFWLCNPDKITMDNEPELNIYDHLQHTVALRGFLPHNYHLFKWGRYGLDRHLIVLNGYVPYIYDKNFTNHLSLTDNCYTFVVKYDIGVLDLPATRELISNTPKNNKTLNKIFPTIKAGLSNLETFIMTRKEKDEQIGAITQPYSPVRIKPMLLDYSNTHSRYIKSSFNGVNKSTNKYDSPQSPTIKNVNNQILIELDDSKKSNVAYKEYAQHVFDLDPRIDYLYFIHSHMLTDKERKIFKVVPLHAFSPIPIKREVVRKEKEQVEKANELKVKRRFKIKNDNQYVELAEILKEPDKYRKVLCERNNVCDNNIEKHLDRLDDRECDCDYKIFHVNKTEYKLVKDIKQIDVGDFVLSKNMFNGIVNAYMMKYLHRKLKHHKKYKSSIIENIKYFLKNSYILYSPSEFFTIDCYNNVCINKYKIREKTKNYKLDNQAFKNAKRVAYNAIIQLINLLDDPNYVIALNTTNILKDEICEKYQTQMVDIFENYKEIFR